MGARSHGDEGGAGRPLVPRDALALRTLLTAELSPDGRSIAYAATSPTDDPARERAVLHVLDADDGAGRALPALDDWCHLPCWHPDGRTLLFLAGRGPAAQLHRIACDGGAGQRLTSREWGVGRVAPSVSARGDLVVFSARSGPPRDPAQPYRVSGRFWRLDGIGLLRDASEELFVQPLDGGAARQLTAHGEIPLFARFSPDGARLLSLSLREGDAPAYRLRIHDLACGEDAIVWESPMCLAPPLAAWLPDGRVMRSTENRVLSDAEPLQLVIDDGAGGIEPRTAGAGIDGWIAGLLVGDPSVAAFDNPTLVVAPDGREAFVTVQAGGRLTPWAIALEGPPAARPLAALAGERAGAVVGASAERLLLVTATMHEPPDLWVARRDGTEAHRLTRLNGERFTPGAHLAVRPLTARGRDGADVEAWFLAPPGADGPVPTLLTVHGGPHAAWGHAFMFVHCLLTSSGFGVLLVNQRGSTGYAPAFAHELLGAWGDHDAGDALAAVDAAVAAGLADPDALGVWGVSGGGWMTAWLTTHDDRFKAAMPENAPLDWSVQEGGDVGWIFARWLTGADEGVPADAAVRAAVSPMTFAERCKTPTLIVSHERDLRCPPANADAWFGLLKQHGCEVEMLRMPTTGHGGSRLPGSARVRLARNEALLEWFGRHLGPRSA